METMLDMTVKQFERWKENTFTSLKTVVVSFNSRSTEILQLEVNHNGEIQVTCAAKTLYQGKSFDDAVKTFNKIAKN